MSKATDIIGGLGSVATSAINAWNGVNPITGISETTNNINMLGNTLYAPGDLTNLSNQFTATTNIQTNGLLNRLNETFGLLFASGLDGMQAGLQLGSAIDGAIKKSNGGHLHSLGGDIGALVGAVLNPSLMAISGAVQDKKLEKYSDLFDTLSNLALQRNVLNFSNAITDSTNMMFDNKALQMKAYGGPLGYFWDTFDNGVRVIKEGGTHEENPHQGVPQGIAPDGLPNLVEEGEVIYNDFVYSDRLKLTKEQAQLFKLGGEMSYAQAALKLSKESEERPNDMISKNGLRDSMNKLKVLQEELKAKNDLEDKQIANLILNQSTDTTQQLFATGGHLFSGEAEMSETLKQLIVEYKKIMKENPTWSLEQILLEMFKVTDANKQSAIAQMRLLVIDQSLEIAKTRTMPGLAVTSQAIPDDKYRTKLKNSGWTDETEIEKEVQRAKREKVWMTDSCAATATDNIYQAMAKYYPQELLTQINNGEIPTNEDGSIKWNNAHGNIYNLSVSKLREITPGLNDVYSLVEPNADFSNLLPGDILSYMSNGTQGHAITFMGYDPQTNKPMFSQSWGGIGPADVTTGTRGFPQDSTYTNGNFPLDAEVTNNRGLLGVPDMIHRYTGNALTDQYAVDNMYQILSSPLIEYLAFNPITNENIESFPTDVRFESFNQQTPTLWNVQQKKGSSELFLYDVSTGNDIDYPNVFDNYDITDVFSSGRFPIANMFNYDLTSPASTLGNSIRVTDPSYLHTSNRESYLTHDLGQASPYKSIVTNPTVLNASNASEPVDLNITSESLHSIQPSKETVQPVKESKMKKEKSTKRKEQKSVVLPTNWYDGLKEITDVNDITGDILHINGKRYRLPLINPFDSNYNGQQLHYVEAKPAVKDKEGNVTQAAVPGHWEVTQGNGAQPLPPDPMADMMRMAPVWGSLAQAMQALSTKPNYQHLDAAIRAASQIPYVNYTPIGNYERFDRIDPNTQANALRAQYAQAMRNMLNSGASRAAVNALQTNALQGLAGALGEAAQTGRAYNNTLKEKEMATQLGIDQSLLGASLDASKTNQGRASAYAQMVGAMAPAKQAIDDAIETNKYTTQTAVANNLGNVGIDKLNRLMLQWMIERGVYPGVAPTKATGGKLKYKTYRKKK